MPKVHINKIKHGTFEGSLALCRWVASAIHMHTYIHKYIQRTRIIYCLLLFAADDFWHERIACARTCFPVVVVVIVVVRALNSSTKWQSGAVSGNGITDKNLNTPGSHMSDVAKKARQKPTNRQTGKFI